MPYKEILENGLVLRSVQSSEDVKKFITFNGKYNNVFEGMTCDCLLRHHPGVRWDDFLLLEEEQSGQVAACVCLIPWELKFGSITLKTAMLEMVLSRPDYRGKGLIRKLIQFFLKIVEEQQYDASIIWGIPYYYRQYGYTYCIDGNAADVLDMTAVRTAEWETLGKYELRPARTSDISILTGMYEKLIEPLELGVKRKGVYWEYMLEKAKHPIHIVEDRKTGCSSGYMIYTIHNDFKTVSIMENYLENRDSAEGVLKLLKAQGTEELRTGWPKHSLLSECVRKLGGKSIAEEQWLFRIRNLGDFLYKMASVIESRLLQSEYRTLSKDIVINLYREAYILCFEQGKLISVKNPGFIDSSMGSDGGDLCVPPEAFIRLILGYRDLSELKDAWPDIHVKKESCELIVNLFPKTVSYINMPYHFQGTQYLFL